MRNTSQSQRELLLFCSTSRLRDKNVAWKQTCILIHTHELKNSFSFYTRCGRETDMYQQNCSVNIQHIKELHVRFSFEQSYATNLRLIFFLKPSLTCDAKVEVLPKWGHNVSLTVCRCLMTKYFDEGNKDKAKEEYCLPDCLTNLFNHTKQNMRQMMSMDEILNLCGSSDDK